MSENKRLSPPPNQRPLIGMDRASLAHQQWFDQIYNKLSPANHQKLIAAGAINLDAQYVDVETSGSTFAVTLAAPTIPGVYKIIEMTADSGHDVTLALTNVVGQSSGTSCAFNDVGDALVLVSLSNKWLVLKEYGVTLS